MLSINSINKHDWSECFQRLPKLRAAGENGASQAYEKGQGEINALQETLLHPAASCETAGDLRADRGLKD